MKKTLRSKMLCAALVLVMGMAGAFSGCDLFREEEDGGISSVQPGETEQQKPGETEQQKPGETEQQKPGETEQQKPGESEQQKPGESEQQKPGESEQQKPGESEQQKPGESEQDTFSVVYRAGYVPEKFAEVTNEVTKLGEGVHLVANSFRKTDKNSSAVVVYTIEVDLKKANIVAGTKGNAAESFNFEKDVPHAMATAWEEATGGHVYASLNADFFGTYCVNAFVKDGVIVKDGHNDNGNYDYKNDAADVPASAPMLFGVKGTTAQIAPILAVEGDPTSAAVKEQFIKAKLGYSVEAGGEVFPLKENTELASGSLVLLSAGKTGRQYKKGYAAKVDLSAGRGKCTVTESFRISEAQTFEAGEGYGWLLCSDTTGPIARYMSGLKEGDEIAFSLTSPDGAWDGFETVLGCRQALVVGDEIASTVTKENSNSAQSTDIPRSAVGIKKDGTVVIFAVESLYYGKRAKEGDTHGMSLPELAEFAYFYGCTQAANFDGGGSTQLIVGKEGEEGKTVIRSSDTGSSALNSTRKVMNSILVTTREE